MNNRDICKRIIAPGVWEDADGNLHFAIPEILAHCDLEDTPENRALATQMAREALLVARPDVLIIEREKL